MWSAAPLHPNSPHYPANSNPAGPLFSPALIPSDVSSALPSGYTIRPLQRSDYKDGMLDVLRVLTTVGDIDEKAWDERYDWLARRGDEYYILVICDGDKKVVGTGALLIERKLYVPSSGGSDKGWTAAAFFVFCATGDGGQPADTGDASIHNLGFVGHIEDIAVAKDQQGKKLGLRIIQALDSMAQKVGCYKVSSLRLRCL